MLHDRKFTTLQSKNLATSILASNNLEIFNLAMINFGNFQFWKLLILATFNLATFNFGYFQANFLNQIPNKNNNISIVYIDPTIKNRQKNLPDVF